MRALFVTLDKCPNIDAGAVRTHMIAKMLVDSQFDVTVISMGPYNDNGLDVVIFFAAQELNQRLRVDADISLPGTDVGANGSKRFPPLGHQPGELAG